MPTQFLQISPILSIFYVPKANDFDFGLLPRGCACRWTERHGFAATDQCC